MKKINTLLFFVFLTGIACCAQTTDKNFIKFQKEYIQLENSVQVNLGKMQSDYDKESGIISQNYQLEVSKLTTEYEGNQIKSILYQKKYKKESQKIISKYDLQTKDLTYKYTLRKAKIENDFHHEKSKLMNKYDIYMNE